MSRVYDKPIRLTSPHERSRRAKDAQYLLNGNNRFKSDWLKDKVDGDWGPASARAADAARWELGYPMRKVKTGGFGNDLYDFLRTTKAKRLSPLMLVRRKKRLAEKARTNTRKARALRIAESYIGTRESPPYSNRVKFSYWYGYIGPWCAMFTSYCLVSAGFSRSLVTALAYQPEWWARARSRGLSITSSPEPGDLVIYHMFQGHIGFFKKWLNRSQGTFLAVEGNTSYGNETNGGAVMLRSRSVSRNRAVFVRVGN